MKQTGSNLVTRAGICLLALVLLAAAYFRADTLVGVTAAFLLISVIAYLWAYFSLSKLSLSPEQPASEGFPGEELCIRACVKNEKVLPVIWLRVKMPEGVQVPGNEPDSLHKDGGKTEHSGGSAEQEFCVRPPQEDGTLQTFLWMMPYQEIEWDLKLRAVRRGVFAPAAFRVSSGDGFGLAEQERDLIPEQRIEVVVFPQMVPVDTAPLRRYVQSFEISRKGIYEDPTLLRQTRSYRYGDPVKAVNWRQTARTGQMIVNLYETQQVRHIALGVDTASYIYAETMKKNGEVQRIRRVREEAFECMVSVLSSAAMDLLDHGLCVTMYLPQGRSGLHRITAQDAGAGRQILRALAYLDPLTDTADLPDEALLAGRHHDGPLFLFTWRDDARILDWLEEHRHASVHVIVSQMQDTKTVDASDACQSGGQTETSGFISEEPAVWELDRIRA